MKVTSRETDRFLAQPPSTCGLILLFGPDAMRIALKREDFVKTSLGANAQEEMRLTRMTGAELRSEPAALQDAVKAIGFFPGPRAVLITEAGDGIAAIVKDALAAWAEGDAVIVLEAGNLGKGSKLRKLAEADPAAAACGIYADPPSRGAVQDQLGKSGLTADNDALDLLVSYAMRMDPGDFRQLLEKLALYRMGATGAASVEDVDAIAPATTEHAIDDAIHAAADGAAGNLASAIQRLSDQGIGATTMIISATRHFRQLHAAASDPGGAGSGIAKLRPPVFGPRRDRMLRQAQSWGMHKLETALTILTDADLALRSSSSAPAMAVTERAFIRIAMLCPRRS